MNNGHIIANHPSKQWMVEMLKIALTIPEAVAISGIGRSSLYAVFKSGGIKPRKSGKRTLVLFADLENYLNSLPVAQ